MISELEAWRQYNLPPRFTHALQHAQLWIPAEQLARYIDQLAVRLTVDFQDTQPLLVTQAPQAVLFSGWLISRLAFPLQHQSAQCCDDEWILSGERDDTAQPTIVVGADGVSELLLDALRPNAQTLTTVALIDTQQQGIDCTALPAPDGAVFGAGLSIAGYGGNLASLYKTDLEI